MDAAQVCDRLRGQETCPFHKGHKITSLCKTCGILVCLKCMMSPEHDRHSFKEITSCLREPTDNLAKHITEIEKKLLVAVEKELSELKKQKTCSIQKHTKGVEEIKEQRKRAHRQIDTNADSMEVQWDEHSQKVLEVFDQHILGLESLRNQFNEERKECSEILQKGSNILKYDAGLEITKKTRMERIPKPPVISELEYKKCVQNFDELLVKAMGILKEVNSKPDVVELPEKSEPPSRVKQHQYHLIEPISKNENKLPCYTPTPVGKNAAWSCEKILDGRTNTYLPTNIICLIDCRRNVVQKVKLDTNIFTLSTHPITRQLFCINENNDKVKSIDITTGKTTKVVKCPIVIHRLKVTHDNHVIVGSRKTRAAIYKYKLTGELVNKSPETYQLVCDIDHCPKTNRVAVSRREEGWSLLNSDLTMFKKYNRNKFDCSSAIFDSYGNLILADHSISEIIVLDVESLSYIQKLEIDGITRPAKLNLYDNILWVDCVKPDKLICVRIS